MRKSLAILIAPVALLGAACGSSSTSTTSNSAPAPATSTSAATSTAPANSAVTVTTRTLPGVGAVLVNGQGRTLYAFLPDKAKKVTCVGGCASVWPPLAISARQKPATSGQVNASLVSSDPNPSGGQVVTYAGWPVYLYVADPTPGTDHGQALNSSGGLWYVISPAGKVITKSASAGTSTTSSTSTVPPGY
jgi:predicted lipoprotein with Yx(FWY)xxD motif